MVTRLATAGRIEHHGEGSGLAREDDRAAGDRIEGDVVAAVGQVDRVQDLACLGQDRRAIGAVAPLEGGGEDGVRAKRCRPCGGRERRQEAQHPRP